VFQRNKVPAYLGRRRAALPQCERSVPRRPLRRRARLAEPITVVCRSLRERSGHSAEPQLNSVSLAAHNPGPKSTAQYLTVKGVLVLSRHG
jgi:hypothetical protein